MDFAQRFQGLVPEGLGLAQKADIESICGTEFQNFNALWAWFVGIRYVAADKEAITRAQFCRPDLQRAGNDII
jgi:hypothetical protein